jgi:hypothetical protein
VNLFTTIPSAPGYLGTFDAPGIKILAAFRVPKEIAGAYTLVLHAALWLPITLLGAFYMWRESISWRDLGEAAKMRKEDQEPPGQDLRDRDNSGASSPGNRQKEGEPVAVVENDSGGAVEADEPGVDK